MVLTYFGSGYCETLTNNVFPIGYVYFELHAVVAADVVNKGTLTIRLDILLLEGDAQCDLYLVILRVLFQGTRSSKMAKNWFLCLLIGVSAISAVEVYLVGQVNPSYFSTASIVLFGTAAWITLAWVWWRTTLVKDVFAHAKIEEIQKRTCWTAAVLLSVQQVGIFLTLNSPLEEGFGIRILVGSAVVALEALVLDYYFKKLFLGVKEFAIQKGTTQRFEIEGSFPNFKCLELNYLVGPKIMAFDVYQSNVRSSQTPVWSTSDPNNTLGAPWPMEAKIDGQSLTVRILV